LPQQKPTLPRGLEGGTPSASKFSSEKFSTKTTFVPFDYIDSGILKTSERDLERQGRPGRGTPTPPGYGYLTHHLPRKVTRARISDSATEQVLTLETRGKKTQLYTLTLKMFRPQRPQETYTYLEQTVPHRLRCRQGEEQHPRCHSYPRRNLARPRTVTQVEGSPPQKKEANAVPGPSAAASSLWTSARATSSSSGKQ
jgi:hypothetical protein